MKRFLCTLLVCFLVFYAGQARAQMTSGTVTTGSITAGGTSTQTFTGTTGQYINLNLSASYNGVITVYKPDGTLWSFNTNRYAGALGQTGTFSVVISGVHTTDSGSYSLYYVRGSSSVSGGSLTSGQTVAATTPTNALTSYQFTGTTGQGVLIQTGASYSTYIYVYKPDGSYWNYGTSRFTTNLPSTGTYTVVVEGVNYSDNGAYNLYYVIGSGAVSGGTLTSGQTLAATLPANALTSYQFTGTSGQGILLQASASYNAYIEVYSPSGAYWTVGTNRVTTTLASTGTYTVVVYGVNPTDTGPYNLYYVRGSDTVSEGFLVSTHTRSGTLPANGLMSYHFSGTSGNSLSVTSTASYSRYLALYTPAGALWTSGTNTLSTTLPSTGQFTLVLYGTTNTATGAYTITQTTTPPAVAATTASKAVIETPPPPPPICPNCPTKTGPKKPVAKVAAGNPINFDVGYKQQAETDYSAVGLSFSRIYRSDSTWTNNTIGTFWRHNYARTLSITGGTAASITDGTGVTTQYTLSGSTWVPNDPSTTATFATITGGYAYTLDDDTVEKYNSSYQLARIEYLGGGAVNLAYNGSGQLTSVTNENGRQLTFTYDTSGRVSTVVTPDGTFTYGYDTHSNLQTVTRPDTKVRTYLYANATYVNALTGITDENGNSFATFGYDTSGRGNLTEYAGGADNKYTIAYNSDGSSTVTNPLSKAFTYFYTNIQGVRRIVEVDGAASTNTPASTMYYNYDSLGRMIGTTDWLGNITRYTYDARDNITSITQAAGTAVQRVTTITPDATFNVPDLITEPGKTTAYAYDTYGRMTSKTVTDTATSVTRVTSYTYNSNGTDGSGNVILGRLATVTGPRTDLSQVTTYNYDTNLNLNKITNPLSQVTNITAIDASGRPTKIVDPNSVETDLSYDSNGRLQTAIQAVGTALAATTTFTYDADGNLTKATLPNSVYVSYSYDNARRLTGVTDALGNTITYTLDNAGNVTQKVVKNTTPATTYTHSQTFDELARLLKSIGASSQTANYAYDLDSNLTSYTDPKTNATGYAFDALNRLATRTDALTGVTTPGYDTQSNLNSVKDQRSNSTTYTYNGFGDVTGETSPDRGTLSYTVDKNGNVTQRTDARSVVTNYTYDALDRLATVAYPSDSTLNVSLTYDLTTGCGTAGVGRLCSVTDPAGTTAYQYDVLGRATQEKDTRGGNNLTTAYSYDLAGTLTGITLPSGRTVTYTLDADGQVSTAAAVVNGSSVNLASSITYVPFGPAKALTYGNTLTFSATFDQDYNPTARSVSGSIYSWTYVTDNNGNVTTAGSTTYGYDALNRVNAENPGTAASYTYDATSNRLTKVLGGTTTTTVPSTSNKISAVGGNSYTYDAAGDITAIGSANTYTWNAAGQLATSVVSGTTVGTYTYDMQNRRTKKVAASTTYYVYGLNGQLYGEYSSAGALIREYVYLNGEPLAQVDTGSPEFATYLHTDHLGTPRFGTKASGTQVWAWANDAFGTSTPTGTATVNLRMAGQYYDSESGLFYNINRSYSPAIGRYISSDPIGLWGGDNTYGYVGANPVNGIDPSGKCFGPLIWMLPACYEAAVATVEFVLAASGATAGLSSMEGMAAKEAQGCEAAIGATGKIGEDALKALGGTPQVGFKTSLGPRVVDQLVNGSANESKVGYTTLTSYITVQIAKDAELMKTGQVNGVTWWFFKSPVTGVGGPSQPLRDALQQAGIIIEER